MKGIKNVIFYFLLELFICFFLFKQLYMLKFVFSFSFLSSLFFLAFLILFKKSKTLFFFFRLRIQKIKYCFLFILFNLLYLYFLGFFHFIQQCVHIQLIYLCFIRLSQNKLQDLILKNQFFQILLVFFCSKLKQNRFFMKILKFQFLIFYYFQYQRILISLILQHDVILLRQPGLQITLLNFFDFLFWENKLRKNYYHSIIKLSQSI